MELVRLIKERIRRQGPITFEAFMEAALYEPGLGYYSSERTDIGKGADFYTSSHLHPLFGAALGRQVLECRQAMDMPADFTVVEMGGGKGHLLKDMLYYLKDKEGFDSLRFVMVELNPHLAKKQKALLSEFAGKVSWAGAITELKEIKGAFLSNEVPDSFPVHLVEMSDKLREIYVSVDKEGRLAETPGEPSAPEIEGYFKEFGIALPQGYRTEVNLRAKKWLSDIASALAEGFVITIDYGFPAWEYYDEERSRGTLLCYRGHETSENPYEHIGTQDMTSHVNFSSLKKWGEAAGLKAVGFSRQGPYLVSLGIGELLEDKGRAWDEGGAMSLEMLKGLIMPGTMGDTHKVLIQYKGKNPPASLRGFALGNRLNSL